MNPTVLQPTPPVATARAGAPFHQIHVRTLKVNTELPFALYTLIEGEYLVYRRENLLYGVAQQDALLENGIDTLFIASDHLDVFWDYLRRSVQHLAEDPQIPLEQRTSLFYQATTELTRQALEKPISEKNIGTANSVVKSSLRLLDGGKAALHSLMREMETQPGLFQSSLNCTQYALALAQDSGVTDPRELEAFGMGILFMDVGILHIPQHLIYKDGPLSFDEWAILKRHPAIGVELLSDLGVTDLTLSIVIGHHERLDGSGYPQGLRADELTLGVRIAGIVDTFNNLTVHPDLRQRVKSQVALQRMKLDMRGQFDTELVERFIRLLGASEG